MLSFPRLPRVLCGGALALALPACATVTQEDPPSQFTGGSDVQFNAPTGSSGGGGTAPIAALPAPAEAPPNPTGPVQATNGFTMPAAPSAGGGASGGGGSTGNIGAAGNGGAPAGPPPPSGMVLLQENFENFQGMGWAASEGSTWQVGTDPQLVSNVYTQTETATNTPDLAVAGDTAWRDVVVEADVKILDFNGESSSYMAGLCVRVRDAENFYLIGVRSNDGKLGLRNYADGGTNLVQSDFEDGTTGVWYHLRVEAIGATITAYLDDELMFSESDNTHANGGIGLCTVRATASFDNVRVTAP